MIPRRDFIRGALACAPLLLLQSACTRHRYIRPAQEIALGNVKSLLYAELHLPIKSILLKRDIDGWAALSTRCTYRGCDLTYQEPVLLCPCCRTRFGLDGVPYAGWPATVPLPWVDIYYRDGHLYANPGKVRPASWRFTTPEIEEAVRKLRTRVKMQTMSDEVKIPKLLTGRGTGDPGVMFLENDPNLLHEIDMIK